MEGSRREVAGGPTTLLTRFAEELRRVLGRKGLRDEGVKGDFGIRPAVAGSRMCGKIRNSEFGIRKGGIWSVEGATGKVRG